jgi:hypothetical protein
LLEKRKKYDPRAALKAKPKAKKEADETTETKASEPETPKRINEIKKVD